MLVLPMVVTYGVLLLRAFPWSTKFSASKPLSCDACMSFWVSLAMVPMLDWFFNAHWSWSLLHLALAPGVTMMLLLLYRRLSWNTEQLTPPG